MKCMLRDFQKHINKDAFARILKISDADIRALFNHNLNDYVLGRESNCIIPADVEDEEIMEAMLL